MRVRTKSDRKPAYLLGRRCGGGVSKGLKVGPGSRERFLLLRRLAEQSHGDPPTIDGSSRAAATDRCSGGGASHTAAGAAASPGCGSRTPRIASKQLAALRP